MALEEDLNALTRLDQAPRLAERIDAFLGDLIARDPGGTLELRVADDGRGFAPRTGNGNGNGHVGLTLMRDLVEQAGGELDVDSAPGEGTVVRATIGVP